MTGGYSRPAGDSPGQGLRLRCRSCAHEFGPVTQVPRRCPNCRAPKAQLVMVEDR